ncbi:phosphoribosyltransferase family protein [Enterococcus sp. HY326]|uniref:phosphoribosyltransferase family protein n=1 Tax=Enterococcus sp. HY326 TaxID=2971265 RepID=UPI00223FC565|nr:phosphoribosyltransferase family protein [Enterococcus sp. HY326]
MTEKNFYNLTVGQLTRQLPIVPITNDMAIASFVLLGDAELTHYAAKLLLEKLPQDFDYIVTFESKGIPLAQELTYLAGQKKYFVLRKSIKSYMENPVTQSVNSITTKEEQLLVLDGTDAAELQGKKVILLDDVISTGASMQAAVDLLAAIKLEIIGKFAILAEGEAADRTDLTYITKLPLLEYPSLKEI